MTVFRKKLMVAAMGCWLFSLTIGAASPLVQRWYAERQVPIGLRDFQQSTNLFDAHEYVAAAAFGRESLRKNLDGSYGPNIALQSWRACSRLNDQSGMDEFSGVMAERYPNSSAASDLSFEAACEEISQGRLNAAEKDISSCISKNSSRESGRFAEMLNRFCITSNEHPFH